jgi:serine/threonine protein kinase
MFLTTINRNISKEEFEKIILNLRSKNIKFKIDSWNYNNILFDKLPNFFPGISQIINLQDEFEIKTISDIIEKLTLMKIKKINYKLKKDLKFHAKAVEDRFLKKSKFFDDGAIIYLEAKHRLGKTYCRIGELISENYDVLLKEREIAILLENSKNSQEIADFLRLGVALKCKVYFKSNVDLTKEINNAKKLFKSNKSKYNIISNLNEIKDYYLIGFSLWGKESEKSLLEINQKKIMLLFGNENRGLLKETLDACNKTIYLGPKSSEPLRANQAAAYAYGILINNDN